jgi:hypothetical protein
VPAELQVTAKTKNAIRVWAGTPDLKVVLNTPLDEIRTEAKPRRQLNVKVNEEFEGRRGFPLLPAVWDELSLTTVRDVRDAVQKKLEGK